MSLGGLATMIPAIKTGRACFDGRRLPRDEFTERIRAVSALCRREGLDALVVVANAASPAEVVYLTNFAPTARVATVVIVPGLDPVLMAGVGGRREEAYQRSVSWVPDLVQAPFSADAVTSVLADRGIRGGRLGVAGLDDQLGARARDRFLAECTGFELVPVGSDLARLRRHKSVRERAVLAELDALLGTVADAGTDAFARSSRPGRAVLAMEEAARRQGCRDVRFLLGWPDGSLRPFEAADGTEDELLVCYAAAEYLGYWAERALTVPWSAVGDEDDLRPVVDAVAASMRPGPLPSQPEGASGGIPGTRPELRLGGCGVDIVELPDEASGWVSLEAGDTVSVMAAGCHDGRILLHSKYVVVGDDDVLAPDACSSGLGLT